MNETIAYVEQDRPGRWQGHILLAGFSTATGVYSKSSQAEVVAVMRRFAQGAKIRGVSKQDFFLLWWREFFLPRTEDPQAPWETLVELAAQDPLVTVTRDRYNRGGGRAISDAYERRWRGRLEFRGNQSQGGSRLQQGPGGDSGSETSEPGQSDGVESPTGRWSDGDDGTGEAHTCEDHLVAPVSYAREIGFPPQYIYNAIYHGKIKSYGERPKRICRVHADRRYRRSP
jgi:hypothetical protein